MKRREPWALSQRTLYRIYFSCAASECQGQFCDFEQFLPLSPRNSTAFSLTTPGKRDKITQVQTEKPVGAVINRPCRKMFGILRAMDDRPYNAICGHGGIGRLGGFRFHCESVQVRVLLPAPKRNGRQKPPVFCSQNIKF